MGEPRYALANTVADVLTLHFPIAASGKFRLKLSKLQVQGNGISAEFSLPLAKNKLQGCSLKGGKGWQLLPNSPDAPPHCEHPSLSVHYCIMAAQIRYSNNAFHYDAGNQFVDSAIVADHVVFGGKYLASLSIPSSQGIPQTESD